MRDFTEIDNWFLTLILELYVNLLLFECLSFLSINYELLRIKALTKRVDNHVNLLSITEVRKVAIASIAIAYHYLKCVKSAFLGLFKFYLGIDADIVLDCDLYEVIYIFVFMTDNLEVNLSQWVLRVQQIYC